MNEKQRIVIIGGGLSGLTLAYLLTKRNIDFIILEASSRLGGRIQTVTGPYRLLWNWAQPGSPTCIRIFCF